MWCLRMKWHTVFGLEFQQPTRSGSDSGSNPDFDIPIRSSRVGFRHWLRSKGRRGTPNLLESPFLVEAVFDCGGTLAPATCGTTTHKTDLMRPKRSLFLPHIKMRRTNYFVPSEFQVKIRRPLWNLEATGRRTAPHREVCRLRCHGFVIVSMGFEPRRLPRSSPVDRKEKELHFLKNVILVFIINASK